MSVSSYSFHSLSLKLPNKEIKFSFLPLKLLSKGREEYSKIIPLIFFPFHSILSFQMKGKCFKESWIQDPWNVYNYSLSPRLGGWNGMKMNEKNNFRISFPSLIWEF